MGEISTNPAEAKSSNTNLHRAHEAKKDEFYTQLTDIEKELKHYKEQFQGKVIYCNCDDPFESNFFKYFAAKFNALGLKKLIATSYAKSLPREIAYRIEITEVGDVNNDGAVNLDDVRYLLEHDDNVVTPLHSNGDFRSNECIEILKEADIVATNPPFSLFREYVAQLVEHSKRFLIIGSKNAIPARVCRNQF